MLRWAFWTCRYGAKCNVMPASCVDGIGDPLPRNQTEAWFIYFVLMISLGGHLPRSPTLNVNSTVRSPTQPTLFRHNMNSCMTSQLVCGVDFGWVASPTIFARGIRRVAWPFGSMHRQSGAPIQYRIVFLPHPPLLRRDISLRLHSPMSERDP